LRALGLRIEIGSKVHGRTVSPIVRLAFPAGFARAERGLGDPEEVEFFCDAGEVVVAGGREAKRTGKSACATKKMPG
jgi:hypothetical protein